MRAAALTIAVIASLLTLFPSFVAFFLTGMGGNDRYLVAATVALGVCLVGMFAGGLAMRWPGAGGVLLLACAAASVVGTGRLVILIGPLFLIAALLAFLSPRASVIPAHR